VYDPKVAIAPAEMCTWYNSAERTLGSVIKYISHCQAVAKLCKRPAVPARRDSTFIIALPWGHVKAPVGFVALKRWDTSSVAT